MTRRCMVGLVVAVVSTLVNGGGMVYAAVRGEMPHAGLHAGLLLLTAYLVWRFAPMRRTRVAWGQGGAALSTPNSELSDRLTHLEQSVDAVALEIERIGEGQRFVTRLFTENGTPRAPGEGTAEPVESDARVAAAPARRY